MVVYGAINRTADIGFNSTANGLSADYGTTANAPQHGPNTNLITEPLSLEVTEGTSTANAGNNTIYIGTQRGLVVVQENRTTHSASTITSPTDTLYGTNLAYGTTAKNRFAPPLGGATNALDNNFSSYFQSNGSVTANVAESLELDLGSDRTFNNLRHFFWQDTTWTPSSYVVEKSTQGTSANLGTTATARTFSGAGYAGWTIAKSMNDNFTDGFISPWNYGGIAIGNTWVEQVFSTPKELRSIDLQFQEPTRTAKDYVLQASTQETTPITIVSAEASTIYSAGYAASATLDNDAGTRWLITLPKILDTSKMTDNWNNILKHYKQI
jgi:hypothetical protein